jgi:hypothetical protein
MIRKRGDERSYSKERGSTYFMKTRSITKARSIATISQRKKQSEVNPVIYIENHGKLSN